jgi:hypothetical protein
MDSLLAHNAVLDTVCNGGTTPLMQAAAAGNFPVVSTPAASPAPPHGLTASGSGRQRGKEREKRGRSVAA